MTTTTPYFRRQRRATGMPHSDVSARGEYIDLSLVHLAEYEADEVVSKAQALFDARAAEAVNASVAVNGVGELGPVRIWPPVILFRGPQGNTFWARDLLELKWYGGKAPDIYLPTGKCLPALAYLDFFPERTRLGAGLREMVSGAVLAAQPGWCGTFGPGVDGTVSLLSGPTEGNYDMTQMHLIPMAYSYYAELSPEARDHLIGSLLARGCVHRPDLPDEFTSKRPPNDWDRAGFISPLGQHMNIGETENHILMIATVRYLTNQLLFQQDHKDEYDNRRNAAGGGQSCVAILLSLLRNILRGDFSEYNAKPYQTETRWALLNLCTYAYDHEVRLGARMVLDYVAAHMAVSSNDLRRMVPFRRRNENDYVARDARGFMDTGLLDGHDKPGPGADPLSGVFAMQAGNTRAYADPHGGRPWPWAMHDNGGDLAIEVLSDYRLPTSIHDLFVSDLHRRFFQRLHRVVRSDEMGGNRNCDNMEIFAGSPSYLITAGGSPSTYAIDPEIAAKIKPEDQRQQLGVAVTTSFMPTGKGGGSFPEADAASLIQFSSFAEIAPSSPISLVLEEADPTLPRNYGVAPDFACGHQMRLPRWAVPSLIPDDLVGRGFWFVNRSPQPGSGPGFYLAIHQDDELSCLEAFDTWLHPEVGFEQFAADVVRRNGGLRLREHEDFTYTTWNGNILHVAIWNRVHTTGWDRNSPFGAEIFPVEYGGVDRQDAMGDAGNRTDSFLNGTVMNSPGEAVVEISNRFLGTTITLDMGDMWHPRRTAENGDIEAAGDNHEVWVDFDWRGLSEGDVYRPFSSIAAATGAVADQGTVRILPGATQERVTLGAGKRFRMVAPLGGAVLGASDAHHPAASTPVSTVDAVRSDDVWVQFDMPDVAVDGPCNSMAKATSAVPDGRVIRIVPGITGERPTIGVRGKHFTIAAPIGGVVIGRGIFA